MRNLKKILALVLALVMVVGMMGIASAAVPGTGFADDASITKFDESVQILEALGIYEGNENGAFNPNDTITRAEVATLVYRVVTQDTAGKYVNIYSDYNQFADVDSNAWYAGYVNFCANGGYLKGDGTNFYPMEKVTGYQVLAIMLRVIGYGMEGEYEGTNWHIRTASKAAELGITKYITAGTLGAYSTRAMVAEMIYRSIAQVSTVSYDRIWMYAETGNTYAYVNFGLHGDLSQTERSAAEIDNKYDEPIAYWGIGSDNKAISIRFNPAGTYSNTVTDSTLFAAGNFSGYSKSVYNYSVDGIPQTAGTLEKTEGYQIRDFGGKGVVVELYVADGRAFIVEKNLYVDIVEVGACVNGKNHKDLLALKSTNVLHTNHWYTDLANGSVVTYNMYNGVVDAYTIKNPNKAVVTVTNTYDTGLNASSYFIAGKTFEYNDNYCTYLGSPILNRDDTGFAPVQVVYTDDFGYVVYTAPYSEYVKAETGYVIIRHGAYGGNIADNRWVGNFTVITADGQQTTIRGAINSDGYYTTQAEASDAKAAELGIYYYVVKNGYYALERIDVADDGDSWTTNVVGGETAGVADFITGYLVDDNTVFVVANYDATDAITGYSVFKGFKNIPDMNGSMYAELVYNKDHVVSLAFIQGVKVQAPNAVGTAQADVSWFLLDTTPEDFVVTYDKHSVVIGGKPATLNFVPNFVATKSLTNWGYKTVGTTNGYISDVAAYDMLNVSGAADGVLYVANVTTGEAGYRAMADSCVVYGISAAGISVLTDAQIDNLNGAVAYEAAYDAYGYITVLYVLL